MKTSVEFLDSVKALKGFTSDYQLSKHLNCTRGAISSYRTGRTYLDDEMACKVAADLGQDSSYVLACIASERAKKPEVKAAWAHAAEVLYGLAAALAIFAILPTATLPTGEFNAAFALLATDTVYYVKLMNDSYIVVLAYLVALFGYAILKLPRAAPPAN